MCCFDSNGDAASAAYTQATPKGEKEDIIADVLGQYGSLDAAAYA